MVACPFRALIVTYWVFVFTLYEIFNVCDTLPAFIHLPGMYTSSDFLVPLYIRVTNLTNEHGYIQTQQLILFVVLGAVDEPLASCMVVQFEVYVFKWQLMCSFNTVDR